MMSKNLILRHAQQAHETIGAVYTAAPQQQGTAAPGMLEGSPPAEAEGLIQGEYLGFHRVASCSTELILAGA
jgi:hypothetical protein